MAYNRGQLDSTEVGKATSSISGFQTPDTRKLFNFGDRVAELAPEESPFFVYLSNVSKVPTDDPVFRYLENRTKTDWTDRTFRVESVNGATGDTASVTIDTDYTFNVEQTAATSSVDWLVPGMMFQVETLKSATTFNYITVRIKGNISIASGYTEFTGTVTDLGNSDAGSGYDTITGNTSGANQGDECQVVGTSFGEGTGSPDTWSSEIEDNFGYTQIFKTAAELTNTAIATVYRGYASEWDRIWNLKLREHKADIERAMLFGTKSRANSVQHTDGIVGNILQNLDSLATPAGTQFSYSSGKSYMKTIAATDLDYDTLLSDLEVMFDPARGGSSEKLVLCSLPVISLFNKIGSAGFLQQSVVGGSNTGFRLNMDLSEQAGAFGHKVLLIETIHGSLQLVKEPLFRGVSNGFMLMCDMSTLAYRPLVGNGVNRDTHIITNVQNADEDLRKDMIITEAGLEVSLPETHGLYAFNI
jgi:hypothetical protein